MTEEDDELCDDAFEYEGGRHVDACWSPHETKSAEYDLPKSLYSAETKEDKIELLDREISSQTICQSNITGDSLDTTDALQGLTQTHHFSLESLDNADDKRRNKGRSSRKIKKIAEKRRSRQKYRFLTVLVLTGLISVAAVVGLMVWFIARPSTLEQNGSSGNEGFNETSDDIVSDEGAATNSTRPPATSPPGGGGNDDEVHGLHGQNLSFVPLRGNPDAVILNAVSDCNDCLQTIAFTNPFIFGRISIVQISVSAKGSVHLRCQIEEGRSLRPNDGNGKASSSSSYITIDVMASDDLAPDIAGEVFYLTSPSTPLKLALGSAQPKSANAIRNVTISYEDITVEADTGKDHNSSSSTTAYAQVTLDGKFGTFQICYGNAEVVPAMNSSMALPFVFRAGIMDYQNGMYFPALGPTFDELGYNTRGGFPNGTCIQFFNVTSTPEEHPSNPPTEASPTSVPSLEASPTSAPLREESPAPYPSSMEVSPTSVPSMGKPLPPSLSIPNVIRHPFVDKPFIALTHNADATLLTDVSGCDDCVQVEEVETPVGWFLGTETNLLTISSNGQIQVGLCENDYGSQGGNQCGVINVAFTDLDPFRKGSVLMLDVASSLDVASLDDVKNNESVMDDLFEVDGDVDGDELTIAQTLSAYLLYVISWENVAFHNQDKERVKNTFSVGNQNETEMQDEYFINAQARFYSNHSVELCWGDARIPGNASITIGISDPRYLMASAGRDLGFQVELKDGDWPTNQCQLYDII